MANQADLLAKLAEANELTNDIARDLDELMNRPDVPDDIERAADALVSKLRGVAAAYPPAPPEQP